MANIVVNILASPRLAPTSKYLWYFLPYLTMLGGPFMGSLEREV